MAPQDNTVMLSGIGFITPWVKTVADLASFCAQEAIPFCPQVDEVPSPEGMNSRELRRMAHLTKLALYAADQAVNHAGLRGQNGGLFVGLTHGTTSLLKEFHDFLFDFGPSMVSPNAFSNGVTNAPLGAVSKLLGLTRGGCTLVGYEQCGMDVLNTAAETIINGTIDYCCAGAVEEYSPIVAETYKHLQWFQGKRPERLPYINSGNAAVKSFPLSEGSVFFAVSSKKYADATKGIDRCCFTPIPDITGFDGDVDIIISGAGGGPQDCGELEILSKVLSRQPTPARLLFTKCFFGETFAVSPLLSSALAWDMLVNNNEYPSYPVNRRLSDVVHKNTKTSSVNSILVVAGNRDREISAGLFTRSS